MTLDSRLEEPDRLANWLAASELSTNELYYFNKPTSVLAYCKRRERCQKITIIAAHFVHYNVASGLHLFRANFNGESYFFKAVFAKSGCSLTPNSQLDITEQRFYEFLAIINCQQTPE